MNGHDNKSFVNDATSSPAIPTVNVSTGTAALSVNKRNNVPYYSEQILTNHYELKDVRPNGNDDRDFNSKLSSSTTTIIDNDIISSSAAAATPTTSNVERDTWGKGIEFLLSCIAMSVGLGNVWRFPFTALENGGGAFLIPYLVVLLLVGKPLYFMEMVLGQFSSKGSVKCYDLAPAMRGVGFGQIFAVTMLTTYYSSLMGLIARYLWESFKNPLPWAYCKESWVNCTNSSTENYNNNTNITGDNNYLLTSSELYFVKEVLKEKDTIHDGIGTPDLSLVIFLGISWLLVLITLIKGVKSSGKASYFLAIFPYVVIGILLVRACTLPGAINGIIYFLKPQWNQILNPKVWYAAVTQVFFSLSVCFGNIIMYASYNKFGHNVHRDATIVTTLDTFTSLLAGCTIFGILGHLAHEIGTDDIASVVKGGTGLAFISYPDAIAKFQTLPQVFSVLFFLMLFVLGIGSNVAMTSCVMTVIRDEFPKIKHWQAATVIAILGVAIGSIYMTPGGQFVLNLVDYFGASFIAFVLAIAELAAISWIYGVDRFCKDCEFMLGFRPNLYWRLCWQFITPALMIVILIYTFITLEPLKYRDYVYPDSAYVVGWCITALGLLQLPIWAIVAIVKQEENTLLEKIIGAFKPSKSWGPQDPALNHKYREFITSLD